MSLLDEILTKLDAMPQEAVVELMKHHAKHAPLWVPNQGGQTLALRTLADELFFGGRPGGGKSFFLVGLALTEHMDAILFRREFPQIKVLEDAAVSILGSRDGYNAQDHVWRIPGSKRTLEFGSVQHEHSVEKHQGRGHSLKGFDEITHFSRAQYRYLTLWLRSTHPGQRCRIVATGNPPTRPEGFWVVEHWAPWLDPRHPDPAQPGELRWAVPLDDESDKELFFRSAEEAIAHVATLSNPPRDYNGEIARPRSRTFIPGELSDNPDLARTGYGAVLGYADKSLRGLAQGKFDTSLPDDEFQVIPTSWIQAAQERWTPQPPADVPMTAVGVDVAQGGNDETVLAWRHDAWFAPLHAVPGVKTPMPSDTAALVVKHRRHGAAIIVDCDGGFGGGVVDRLKDNKIEAIAYKGSGAGFGRTKDKRHGFRNKRAMSTWRLREALDPDQFGGSPIALPPDAALRADLASYRYSIEPRGIQIEDKDEIKKRIGRSPDRGDAVVMAWSEGQAALRKGLIGPGSTGAWTPPVAKVGYEALKRRRNS